MSDDPLPDDIWERCDPFTNAGDDYDIRKKAKRMSDALAGRVRDVLGALIDHEVARRLAPVQEQAREECRAELAALREENERLTRWCDELRTARDMQYEARQRSTDLFVSAENDVTALREALAQLHDRILTVTGGTAFHNIAGCPTCQLLGRAPREVTARPERSAPHA